MKSQKALNGKVDENLCLLCIQCFEVCLAVNIVLVVVLLFGLGCTVQASLCVIS